MKNLIDIINENLNSDTNVKTYKYQYHPKTKR